MDDAVSKKCKVDSNGLASKYNLISTCTNALTQYDTHIHTRTHVCTHTHARTHARTHTHTHTDSLTHTTLSRWCQCSQAIAADHDYKDLLASSTKEAKRLPIYNSNPEACAAPSYTCKHHERAPGKHKSSMPWDTLSDCPSAWLVAWVRSICRTT